MPRKYILLIIVAIACLPVAAQSDESLGDAARRIRAERDKAATTETPAKPAPAWAPAASRGTVATQKVAEGEYGLFSSWTLWTAPDRALRADIDMHVYSDLARAQGKLIQQKETLTMDEDFTMRGFRYESKNFRGLPDGALECMVNPASLDCVSTFEGQSGKGKINASGGYSTQFGVEIALLDLPWFFTTLVGQSDRDRKQPRTFGIVNIAFDGQTPDTLVTGQGADAEVRYLRSETLEVLGQKVKAHKFLVEALHYPATVWVADSGLLLAANWYDMHIELTRFRQWAKLVPEFPVEAGAPTSKP